MIPARHQVFVKQQGAQCSGTNYLRFLLEANFSNVTVLVDAGRWKHAAASEPMDWAAAAAEALAGGRRAVVVSVRHPLTWAASFLSRYHSGRSAAEAFAAAGGATLEHLMRSWSDYHRGWIDPASADRTVVVRYEDLLDDHAGELDRLAAELGLKAIGNGYRMTSYKVAQGSDGTASRESGRHWRDRRAGTEHCALARDATDAVRAGLDPVVAAHFEYRVSIGI